MEGALPSAAATCLAAASAVTEETVEQAVRCGILPYASGLAVEDNEGLKPSAVQRHTAELGDREALLAPPADVALAVHSRPKRWAERCNSAEHSDAPVVAVSSFGCPEQQAAWCTWRLLLCSPGT